MAIDGINGGNVENWRNKPVKEIVNNIDIVEEEDSEVAEWAQAMAAVANAPDNVTYDMAGGSVEAFTQELDEITENGGVPAEEAPEENPEEPEAVGKAGEVPPEEEEPDVGDVDETNGEEPGVEGEGVEGEEEVPPEGEVPAPEEETEGEEEEVDPLANDAINTDDEEIRKRKIKNGEEPEE